MRESGKLTIRFKNLSDGEHQFELSIGDDFFNQWLDSPIKQGQLDVHVSLYKATAFGNATMKHQGHVWTTCDRCLEALEVFVEGDADFLIRNEEEENDDVEVVCINPEDGTIDLTKLAYDYITLSVPMVNYCPDDRPCNKEILERLNQEEDQTSNPAWDELKNLNL